MTVSQVVALVVDTIVLLHSLCIQDCLLRFLILLLYELNRNRTVLIHMRSSADSWRALNRGVRDFHYVNTSKLSEVDKEYITNAIPAKYLPISPYADQIPYNQRSNRYQRCFLLLSRFIGG